MLDQFKQLFKYYFHKQHDNIKIDSQDQNLHIQHSKKTLTKRDMQLSLYFGLQWVRSSRQTSECKHMSGRWHCVAGTGSAGALSCISKTPRPSRNAHGGPRIRAGGASGYGGLRPSLAVRKSRALGPVNWQALQEPGKCRSNSTRLSTGLCQFYQWVSVKKWPGTAMGNHHVDYSHSMSNILMLSVIYIYIYK